MMPSLTCKRIFLIVLDSFGIGELPDAAAYGDAGSNTLASISHSPAFRADTLQRLGLFNIEGVDCREGVNAPLAAYGRCVERSKGKDTKPGTGRSRAWFPIILCRRIRMASRQRCSTLSHRPLGAACSATAPIPARRSSWIMAGRIWRPAS